MRNGSENELIIVRKRVKSEKGCIGVKMVDLKVKEKTEIKRLEGTVAIGCVLDSKKTGDSVSNENWRTASVIWFSSSPNQINVISPWSSIFTRLQASNTSIASVLRMLIFDEP